MSRKVALTALLSVCLALPPMAADAAPAHQPGAGGRTGFVAGEPGLGDPYFPLAGNGGYNVKHYLLDLDYDPATDVLSGTATITAAATKNLSRFNLDLDGLTVRSIKVDGRSATWSRDGGELTVTPSRGLRNHTRFTTVVTYDGVPETIGDPPLGVSGFMHTDDGAMVAGQPEVAATWFPVNDHPSDKAAYTFKLAAPEGLEVIANGVLKKSRTRLGWTTWTWDAKEPMASYLATMAVGEFDVRAYRQDGLRFWDALDPDLSVSIVPRTGDQFALSQASDLSYKRLARTISVPASGGQLSFWVDRATEPDWDFAFVEAHTVGQDDWTTLPDLNGHTGQGTGNSCPFWLSLHPFLEHYQADNGDGTCSPAGTSGAWWAATGDSDGYELWAVDLSPYAGSDVEVSISYASDDVVQLNGVVVDDITVSTGVGSTSFEDDGDALDGWTVPGAPPGSEANPNDWIVGTVADAPPTVGDIVDGSFARQGEIIDFLSDTFGRYPFSAAGGIVDDTDQFGFALETQTRPIYAMSWFGDPLSGDNVIVHELAHQWYGDSLALERWQDIWLNEGFATYAEFLWSEREGLGTAQEVFDSLYEGIPSDDPFWSLTIGDPGPDALFDFAVYARGAMTLHQLRLAVGDDDFFRILRQWSSSQAGGNVTTAEFIHLAESVSGQELDDLFQAWLFTPGRPDATGLAATAKTADASLAPGPGHVPPAARNLLERLG